MAQALPQRRGGVFQAACAATPNATNRAYSSSVITYGMAAKRGGRRVGGDELGRARTRAQASSQTPDGTQCQWTSRIGTSSQACLASLPQQARSRKLIERGASRCRARVLGKCMRVLQTRPAAPPRTPQTTWWPHLHVFRVCWRSPRSPADPSRSGRPPRPSHPAPPRRRPTPASSPPAPVRLTRTSHCRTWGLARRERKEYAGERAGSAPPAVASGASNAGVQLRRSANLRGVVRTAAGASRPRARGAHPGPGAPEGSP